MKMMRSLVAERVVVAVVRRRSPLVGEADNDEALMEDLLAKEEGRADDLADLLVDLSVNPATKNARSSALHRIAPGAPAAARRA